MDVRIGVTYSPKELDVDLGDAADPDAVRADVENALATESGVLWLVDRRGRRVGVPVSKVAYVEISGKHEDRRIGFGSG